MKTGVRKSTPEVKGGQVQKKNDWSLTPDYYSHTQRDVIVDRKRPGPGYRHLLKTRDIRTFIGLLPDWGELSLGLNGIVLAPGEFDTDGYHVPGVVHVCAWDEAMWVDYEAAHYEAHKDIFARLGVPCEALPDGYVRCQFTDETARAYQLLHILLHELGHHHDRITTKKQKRAGRGESYAEEYALRYETLIWERYGETFGLF